jgi:proline iminopeptidase
MPQVRANGIDIAYESYGRVDAEPVLLICGLGVQLVGWPKGLIDGLVQRGFRVIAFDNRDCGLSQKFDAAGPADLAGAFAKARAKEKVPAPYALEDMADDAAGLLDALNIPAAHVVGSSNGGAIAQLMAIRHPDKVRSLTSIMATSGRRGLPRPSEAANAWLMKARPPVLNREQYIEEGVESARIVGSPIHVDEAAARDRAARQFDRSYYPVGHGRHLLASIASGDARAAHLGEIRCPTLVLHGRLDPLVPLGCGEDVAKSIPGARLVVLDEMAHDLPAPLLPRIVDEIATTAKAARA